MTEKETLKLFALLEVAYPALKKMTDEEFDATIKLWAEMFDEAYQVVWAAVKSFIATDEVGFAPKIGQIKAQIRKFNSTDEMTEIEAANRILEATRNSIYNAGEEYKKLPPVLQKLVGSPRQLREWAAADSQTINTVVASNLQRSYKVVAARQRELEALPAEVRLLLG